MSSEALAILDAAKEVIRRARIVANDCVGANDAEARLIGQLRDALEDLRVAPEPQSLRA